MSPFYRRAGACPPPCCGLLKPREGQALALRCGEGDWAIERSRGTGPRATVWGRWLGPPDDREGQAVSVYRRAGACPPPCCGLLKPREGQALALRCGEGDWAIERSRGTGPRATVWGRWLGPPDDREGQALALREWRQSRHNIHRLQTYRNHRTDELYNSLRGLRIVRGVGDLTSIVCLDPILIQHPL